MVESHRTALSVDSRTTNGFWVAHRSAAIGGFEIDWLQALRSLPCSPLCPCDSVVRSPSPEPLRNFSQPSAHKIWTRPELLMTLLANPITAIGESGRMFRPQLVRELPHAHCALVLLPSTLHQPQFRRLAHQAQIKRHRTRSVAYDHVHRSPGLFFPMKLSTALHTFSNQ